MHRDRIAIIRDASNDIAYYRLRRRVFTAALVALGIVFAVAGFLVDDPYLLGKFLRYLGGGFLGLSIVNVIACTLDIRNARRVADEAEAGGLD